MTMTRLPLRAALVLVGATLASPALASDTSLHSGVIASIDVATHTLRLEQMGPWQGESTKPFTRTIALSPDTKYALVTRAKGPNPQGWIGGYIVSPLAASAVRPGDFANVTVARDRKGHEATMVVEIVRPVETKS
jgi:hypothetical protein